MVVHDTRCVCIFYCPNWAKIAICNFEIVDAFAVCRTGGERHRHHGVYNTSHNAHSTHIPTHAHTHYTDTHIGTK